MGAHFNKDIINLEAMDYHNLYNNVELLNRLIPGERLSLKPEPNNPRRNHKSVGVYHKSTGRKIAYIQESVTEKLANILNRGSYYNCTIEQTFGDKSRPGIRVNLTTYPVKQKPHGKKHQPRTGNSPSNPRSKNNNAKTTHPAFTTPTGKSFRSLSNFEKHRSRYAGVSGIYTIWHRGGEAYVGQSTDIARRWKEHYTALSNKNHSNKNLQVAWSSCGKEHFRFDILEESPVDLDAAEKAWIEKLDTFNNGYNATPDGQPIAEYIKKVNIPLPQVHPPLNKNEVHTKEETGDDTLKDLLALCHAFNITYDTPGDPIKTTPQTLGKTKSVTQTTTNKNINVRTAAEKPICVGQRTYRTSAEAEHELIALIKRRTALTLKSLGIQTLTEDAISESKQYDQRINSYQNQIDFINIEIKKIRQAFLPVILLKPQQEYPQC